MNPADAKKVRLVRAEVERLLEEKGEAESFGRILRLSLQEQGRIFSGYDHSRWLFVPLWVCESLDCSWEMALPVATAVELVGAASDVFDDLQDQDNPSSPLADFSPAEAMNAGLALIGLAFKALSHAPEHGVPQSKVPQLVSSLSEFISKGAEGQYLDGRLIVSRDAVNESSYFEVVNKKSGTPVKYACLMGAQVATDDQECIGQFAEFGSRLGVAFQISNDLAFFADPSSSKSDIRGKKLTLPVVYGLSCINGPEGEFFKTSISATATSHWT